MDSTVIKVADRPASRKLVTARLASSPMAQGRRAHTSETQRDRLWTNIAYYRPSAHGGQKEDGGEDKRVSSEHGFGMFALGRSCVFADRQAETEREHLRRVRRADPPVTRTAG